MEQSQQDLAGQRVGSYQIIRLLGEGGMGEVYEAKHEQLQRRAAIKLLKREYAQNPQIADRFLNEARIVSVIHHPGLVAVLELGQTSTGRPFIVMEFLAGESLSLRIERNRGKLGPDALRIGRQIASTLAAVHKEGVVHRDLKPDNIMMVADQEAAGGERAKLLDFGIAKIAQEGVVGSQLPGKKTRTGLILGTPQYMAPEQCRGAGAVDEKADVYSLGVILYEMIVGVPPFQADGAGELMALQMYHPPPPLFEVAPWVSAELATLVHGMLAKDAKDRPSAAQVADGLELLGAPRANASSRLAAASGVSKLPSLVVKSQASLQRNSAVGTGQVQYQTTQRVDSGLRGQILIWGLLCASGVLIGTSFAIKSRIDSASSAAAALPVAKQIDWRIDSQPTGASVISASTGVVLGTTPFHSNRPAGQGMESLILRFKGYEDSPLAMDRNQNERKTVQLRAQPAIRISWRVHSRPAGATVVRTDRNQTLGQTPLELQLMPEQSVIPLVIRMPRYQEQRIELDGRKNQDRTVNLKKKDSKDDLKVSIKPEDD